MPFVKTPYFIVASQYDQYQLQELTQSTPSEYTTNTTAYVEDFGGYDRTGLRNLSASIEFPGVQAGASKLLLQQLHEQHEAQSGQSGLAGGFGFFAWACYNHAVSPSTQFYTTRTIDGYSQKSALEAYLARNPTNTSSPAWSMMWMDECRSFDCGLHCHD